MGVPHHKYSVLGGFQGSEFCGSGFRIQGFASQGLGIGAKGVEFGSFLQGFGLSGPRALGLQFWLGLVLSMGLTRGRGFI